LADILHDSLTNIYEKQSQFYERSIALLEQNGIFNLIDWKAIRDPKLKKRFGVKVITTFDIAAGNIQVLFLYSHLIR
jgi:hypothetical protein